MAWTTPRTWVDGETETASIFNTHIRDNFKAIGAAWTSYVPTLTASTTSPTLGTGSSATGASMQAGKLVIGFARIVFGTSGMAAGSGTYRVSLPVNALRTTRPILARVLLGDVSANAICQPTAFTGTAGVLEFYYPATWPSGTTTTVTNAAPWAWAASDYLDVTFCYEAA